ncbi:MAG: zinc ribbon domain-containing protein [Dehalococcoidia bacterium]
MSLPEQLYRLQQIDLELREKQQALNDVEKELRDTEAVVAAESRLAIEKQQLEEVKGKQKGSEWELEDLQEKVKQINNKLYGGTNKNPKELVNLEKELQILRGQINSKEDALLGLMTQVEEMEVKLETSMQEFGRLKEEWRQRQKAMGQRREELETALAGLMESRRQLAEQIKPQVLELYERIRLTKEPAVVKVERGRCQGCHITVPTSQWQKAKAGHIVQCSSCNRILSVE